MKAITLYEPWASLIAIGAKTIETRLHNRAIHAGKKYDANAFGGIMKQAGFFGLGCPMPEPRHGEVVCTVFVSEAEWLGSEHSEAALLDCSSGERFGLILKDPMPIQNSGIIRGKQGIWTWELNMNSISYL